MGRDGDGGICGVGRDGDGGSVVWVGMVMGDLWCG